MPFFGRAFQNIGRVGVTCIVWFWEILKRPVCNKYLAYNGITTHFCRTWISNIGIISSAWQKKSDDFISRRIPTNTLAVCYLRVLLSVAQESCPTIGRNNWLGSLSDLRAQRPELSERIMSVKFEVRLKVVSLELSEDQ